MIAGVPSEGIAVRTSVAIGSVVLGGLGLVAAAYAVVRATGDAHAAKCSSSCECAEPAPSPGALSGAARPVTLQAGSLFRNRLSAANSPLDGIEAVLLTARQDECLDTCPPSLRIEKGDKGGALLDLALDSLRPNLDLLAEDPGLPADVRRALRAALAEFDGRRRQGADPASARLPLRALFINLPRADVGKDCWSTGVALYDHADPHFDASEGPVGPGAGVRILIGRVERLEDGKGGSRLLSGALEVGRFDAGTKPHAMLDGPDLGRVFASLWGHFGVVPRDACGLHLAADGTLSRYGADLALVRLDAPDSLRRAFAALLRRP